jgi:hypothetical protein
MLGSIDPYPIIQRSNHADLSPNWRSSPMATSNELPGRLS